MAEFFDKDNRIAVEEEVDASNLSRLNPNLTLGHFQEQQERERVKLRENLPEFKPFENLHPANDFENRQFKKQADKAVEIAQIRFKLFAITYLLVTIILTGFVIYNLVATAILSNEAKRNNTKINELNKVINKMIENEQASSNVFFELPKDLNL